MKKHAFSKNLFLESFRQLCGFGIFCTLLVSIISVYVPVSNAVEVAKSWQLSVESEHTLLELGVLNLQWPMLFLASVAVPLFTLYSFRFLNKRSSSDFYHALPYTRVALYFSTLAAVMAWAVLITVFSVGLSLLSCTLCKKYILFNGVAVLCHGVNQLLTAALVAAAVGVAVSVTGNTVSNFAVSLMIIFLPRIFIYMISSVPALLLPFVQNNQTGLFSPTINLAVALVVEAFETLSGGLELKSFTSFQSGTIIYNVVLTLAYLGLGCVLFQRRKSETAAAPAVSKPLQALFRIVLTMLYCAVVCVNVFRSVVSYNDFEASSVIISFAVAVLLYFGYELVTTKKWRSLWKTLPGLAVVAVLNIAFLFGMQMVYNHALHFAPTTQEIKSLSVVNSQENISRSIDESELVSLRAEELEITDPEILNLVSKRLKAVTDFVKENPEFSEYYSEFYKEMTVNYTFKICTAHGTYYRVLPLEQEDANVLAEQMSQNTDYLNLWKNPVEPLQNTLKIYSNDNSYCAALNETQKEELFRLFQSELQKVNFKDYLLTLQGFGEEEPAFYFRYSGKVKGEIYNISLNVYEAFFPKTCKAHREMSYETQEKDREALKQLAQNGILDEEAYLNILAYSPTNGEIMAGYSKDITTQEHAIEATAVLKQCLAEHQEHAPAENEAYYFVEYTFYKTEGEKQLKKRVAQSYSAVFTVPNLTESKLPECFE